MKTKFNKYLPLISGVAILLGLVGLYLYSEHSDDQKDEAVQEKVETSKELGATKAETKDILEEFLVACKNATSPRALAVCERAQDTVDTINEGGSVGATGSTGPQGPEGPAGPTGPMGFTGIAGPRGPRGFIGPMGPAGANGLNGEDGQDGIGIVGAAGQVGPIGPIGPQGPAGETGARGPQGETGQQGSQGPAGPTCPEGFQGMTLTVEMGSSPLNDDTVTIFACVPQQTPEQPDPEPPAE